MKYTIAALLATTGLGLAATTFNATNVNPAQSQGVLITDNTGAPTSNASWGIGTFTGTTDFLNPSGPASVAGWVPLTTTGTFSAVPGVFGSFGSFGISGDIANSNQPADDFVGNNVFVVIGNAPTFGDSTDFVIYDSGVPFIAETELDAGADVTIRTNQLTAVRGIPTTSTGVSPAVSYLEGAEGITFGAIPEPSTSLLAGLAGLALVVRRKR